MGKCPLHSTAAALACIGCCCSLALGELCCKEEITHLTYTLRCLKASLVSDQPRVTRCQTSPELCRMSLRNSYLQPLWGTWASLCQPLQMWDEKKGDTFFPGVWNLPSSSFLHPVFPSRATKTIRAGFPQLHLFDLCGTIIQRAVASDADGDGCLPSSNRQFWSHGLITQELMSIVHKRAAHRTKESNPPVTYWSGIFCPQNVYLATSPMKIWHTAKWTATWGLWATVHL